MVKGQKLKQGSVALFCEAVKHILVTSRPFHLTRTFSESCSAVR